MAFNPSAAVSFGVEIELLISPPNNPKYRKIMDDNGWDSRVGPNHPYYMKDAQARNRHALRTAIAALLTAGSIPAIAEEAADYDKWSVLDEESLDEIPGYWRIELVSRVLSSGEDWQGELADVFEVLEGDCKIRITTGCSMHVHVSPFGSTYTTRQLRGVCKGVCYYDHATTKVLPAERKDNPWATSNVVGRGGMVNQKLKRAYSLVPSGSWAQLFKMLDKVTPLVVYETMSAHSRYMAWNFQNVTKRCGTIEFRRPPGADSAAKAIHWVAFALGFVTQAMAVDWAGLESRNTVGSVADLHAFVTKGLQMLGPTCSGALNDAKVVEDTSAPTVLTAADLAAIDEKMKVKEKVKASPFVEKVNSRPNTPVMATAQLATA